jgi:hypothetical protein
MHGPMNVKIIGKLMKERNFTPLLAVLRQLIPLPPPPNEPTQQFHKSFPVRSVWGLLKWGGAVRLQNNQKEPLVL